MRRWAVLPAVLAFVFAVPGVALGYWLSAPTPATIEVRPASLPAGRPPAAVAHGHSVTVRTSPAGPVLLRRYHSDGRPAATLRCEVVCTEAGVPDGAWTYTETPVLATWRGQESGPSPVVTVDTTPPALTVTSAVATHDRSPVLTGTAGRSRGDTGRVTVQLLTGNHLLLQRIVPVRAGHWRLPAGPLRPQRSYTVLVRQQDSAGNHGLTRASFVLDTIGPAVTLNPVRWPVFDGTAGTATASAGTSADSATVRVQIFAAGRLLRTLTGTRAGRLWSIAGTGLGSGAYTARVLQSDAAGNVSTSPLRGFAVDATAPAVTVTVPRYVNTAPILAGRAGTADGDAGTVLVEVSAGGPVVQRLRVPVRDGAWRAVLRPLPPNQSYLVTARQDDSAGNWGSASAPFVLDIVAPKPELTYLDGQLSGSAGVQVSSEQASADEPIITLEFFRDSSRGQALAAIRTVPVIDGAYSASLPDLPAGSYQVRAVQRDVAGNVGASNRVIVTVLSAGPR